MIFQIIILLGLLFSISGILFWYWSEKNKMKRFHYETVVALNQSISRNRNQIDFRILHLNRYDFLKYNLNEALVTQKIAVP
ncbi:hypothetical protein [Aequorivita marina]|uniref:hypothetical protein n=1 Tax=Aequorivita marina TaxID=3073654 RepID=UPI002876A6A6|nr:hypothetical protein [Aequorivita sp. S2608]MDS1297202.1 hypothetical protein [Aequorivita sp. S2608]